MGQERGRALWPYLAHAVRARGRAAAAVRADHPWCLSSPSPLASPPRGRAGPVPHAPTIFSSAMPAPGILFAAPLCFFVRPPPPCHFSTNQLLEGPRRSVAPPRARLAGATPAPRTALGPRAPSVPPAAAARPAACCNPQARRGAAVPPGPPDETAVPHTITHTRAARPCARPPFWAPSCCITQR